MDRRQLRNVLLCNLQYLVLQAQIKRAGYYQTRTGKVSTFDMECCRQFVDPIISEMWGEVVLKPAPVQETGLLCFNKSSTFLHRRDVALESHLQEHILHACKRCFGVQKWVVRTGRAGNTRQHRRLGNVKLRG